MVKNTVYQYVGSNLWVQVFFRENIRKRVRWNRKLRLCTLCVRVWRKFHLHLRFMFYLRYSEMVQSLYRSWPLVSKITWGIRTTSYKQWQFQKVKFDGLLWRKTTFLQIKHYIQRIYLILLSITCVKIRQITYAISETISHFSQHNSSVSFYLKHYILSIQDFPQLRLKFTKFLMSVCQIKSQLVFKVWIFFQCHER